MEMDGVNGKHETGAKSREQIKLMFRSQNWKENQVCQEVEKKEES